jgi:indole-3-glycerol phosphate synthase
MILERIVETKKGEVARLKEEAPLSRIRERLEGLPPPRDFRRALSGKDCSLIAEVKKRSPSKGVFRQEVDPVRTAVCYEVNGASAVSVLTDRTFFGGEGAFLGAIREAVSLPLLRKDFIIDPYQIYETRLLGGDSLLLIAAILGQKDLEEYIGLSASLGFVPLVEVHSREELGRALSAGAEIIGINNRDLRTFTTDLGTSLELASLVPGDRVVVSESGIHTREDVKTLAAAGIHAFLVGEVLMRSEAPGEKLKELLGR